MTNLGPRDEPTERTDSPDRGAHTTDDRSDVGRDDRTDYRGDDRTDYRGDDRSDDRGDDRTDYQRDDRSDDRRENRTQYARGDTTTTQPASMPTRRDFDNGDISTRKVRETKPAILTTEFWFTLGGIAALIAVYLIEDDPSLDLFRTALLSTLLGLAYIISRGLAKAGSRTTRQPDDPRIAFGRDMR